MHYGRPGPAAAGLSVESHSLFRAVLNNVYSVRTIAAVLCVALEEAERDSDLRLEEAERDSDLRHRLGSSEAAASYIRR